MTSDDEMPKREQTELPEHVSLAAQDVEEVVPVVDGEEKRLRRMTMPNPKGLQVTSESGDSPGQASVGNEDTDATQSNQHTISEVLKDDPDKQLAPAVKVPQPSEIGPVAIIPFGLPAIREVLRVVISLLDPQASPHTDSMRLLGLNLLTTIFETAGAKLAAFPSLRSQVQDTACKHLFQLARSESFAIDTFALRCICAMFQSMREDLKLQFELLLTFLIDRLSPTFPMSQHPWSEMHHDSLRSRSQISNGSETTGGNHAASTVPPPPPPPPMPRSSDKAPAQGDVRDLTLEALALLMMADDSDEDPLLALFINFDCDIDCDDLYMTTMRFLCRSVFAAPPGSQVQDGLQVYALDTILAFVERLLNRQEQESEVAQTAWPADFPTIEHLEQARARKDDILEGAKRFNVKPRDGLVFFEEKGFIKSFPSGGFDSVSVAHFLKDCSRLDKKVLGEFLAKPANEELLHAFLRLLDFEGKPLSEAMREMLEAFRLPGEAQQISRITEAFSKVYFETAASREDFIKNEDAVYVLAFSVIMLNTDLHNAQNKRKMKVDDYRRNLRGVNNGQDFDEDYLGAIYENIRKREIVMPEEHLGQLGFDYAWKELLRRSCTSTKLCYASTSRFDREMFATCWREVVACIAHAFSTFQDEGLLERAISGYRSCAILAGQWGMYEVFDYMVEGLAHHTGLVDGTDESVGPSTDALQQPKTVDVEGTPIPVSPLSIRFGMDFKGQLAAVVLFTIAHGNGKAIRVGWTPLVEILKNLFGAGLLPAECAGMIDVTAPAPATRSKDDVGTARIPIPFKPPKAIGMPQQDPRGHGGSLFSTLSSYLLSPYSQSSEPAVSEATSRDVEASLCTADCLASCRVAELYHQVLALDDQQSVLSAVRSLRQLADRLTLGQLAAAAAASHHDGSGVSASGAASSQGRSTPVVGRPATPNARQPLQQLPYDPRAVFVLELLTNVVCSAATFVADTFDEAVAQISSLLQSPRNFHPALLERAIVCLWRLADVACAGQDFAVSKTRSPVSYAVELLGSLPADMRPVLNPAIVGGLRYILALPRDSPFARTIAEWDALLDIVASSLSTRTAKSIELSYTLISKIAESHLSMSNFVGTVQLLRDVAQSADPEALLREVHKREKSGYRLTLTEKKELTDYVDACRNQGPLAVQKLESVKAAIPGVLKQQSEAVAAWSQCWLTLTSALASQCINTHRGTRQAALESLQRVMLSGHLTERMETSQKSLASGVRQIFLTSLFPVLDQLVPTPESPFGTLFPRESDPAAAGGLWETRRRICGLLCRTFLHFATMLNTEAPQEFEDLWHQVLDHLDRFIQTGQQVPEGKAGSSNRESSDVQLIEAVTENTKNALLVLNASGILVPPNSEHSASAMAFWHRTSQHVEKYLPGLMKETFTQGISGPRESAFQETMTTEDRSSAAAQNE